MPTSPSGEPLPTAPIRPDLWLLDPAVAHLNHGSYGAVPTPVLEAQRRAAEAIERSPERCYRADPAPAIAGVRPFFGQGQGGRALEGRQLRGCVL